MPAPAAEVPKETKVMLAVGLAALGIAIGIFLLPMIGNGLRSLGIDISVYSDARVKDGLFTIAKFLLLIAAAALFAASQVMKFKAGTPHP